MAGETPWTVNAHRLSDQSLCVVHVVDGAGSAVAQLHGYGEEETLYRARLIAAAPEMAELLRWLRANYASGPTAEINARIDALLSKITGEA